MRSFRVREETAVSSLRTAAVLAMMVPDLKEFALEGQDHALERIVGDKADRLFQERLEALKTQPKFSHEMCFGHVPTEAKVLVEPLCEALDRPFDVTDPGERFRRKRALLAICMSRRDAIKLCWQLMQECTSEKGTVDWARLSSRIIETRFTELAWFLHLYGRNTEGHDDPWPKEDWSPETHGSSCWLDVIHRIETLNWADKHGFSKASSAWPSFYRKQLVILRHEMQAGKTPEPQSPFGAEAVALQIWHRYLSLTSCESENPVTVEVVESLTKEFAAQYVNVAVSQEPQSSANDLRLRIKTNLALLQFMMCPSEYYYRRAISLWETYNPECAEAIKMMGFEWTDPLTGQKTWIEPTEDAVPDEVGAIDDGGEMLASLTLACDQATDQASDDETSTHLPEAQLTPESFHNYSSSPSISIEMSPVSESFFPPSSRAASSEGNSPNLVVTDITTRVTTTRVTTHEVTSSLLNEAVISAQSASDFLRTARGELNPAEPTTEEKTDTSLSPSGGSLPEPLYVEIPAYLPAPHDDSPVLITVTDIGTPAPSIRNADSLLPSIRDADSPLRNADSPAPSIRNADSPLRDADSTATSIRDADSPLRNADSPAPSIRDAGSPMSEVDPVTGWTEMTEMLLTKEDLERADEEWLRIAD